MEHLQDECRLNKLPTAKNQRGLIEQLKLRDRKDRQLHTAGTQLSLPIQGKSEENEV